MIAATGNLIHNHFANPARHANNAVHGPPLHANPPNPPAPPPTPGAGSSTSAPARRSMAEAHVSNENYEASRVYAYVHLEQAVHSPHLFIHYAMEQVCGAPPFHLAASSRGVGIMVFATMEAREHVVSMSPINYDVNTISVEPHEEADNRFYAFYHIYAEITAVDFPLEHWEEALAREALGVIGNVCCTDPVCLLEVDFTSMRAVVRLDHDREVPEQLLVRNHSGPTSIATIYTIRTWLDANPVPDFSNYTFGPVPALHTAPHCHPVGNPPTQMPAAPENLVATVLEWEIPTATPNLRPVRTRRATPYPTTPLLLALPWYGVCGVPLQEVDEEIVTADAATALADLSLDVPPVFSAGGRTEEEHESRAQKRSVRRKRAKDSARKLRRSLRLKEKEEATFELPEDKAARVQQAKFDFSVCGVSEEEIAGISGVAASPSTRQ
ncbi:uncharacterized protein [Miscanthus floridulus]|uniref:uncharacterized protein n=1 Tax=Miscanthus floridulus TaxID=154761 RepID=UPI00345A06FD